MNEAIEPKVNGVEVINLLEEGILNAWIVPSNLWSFEEGTIIGNTGEEKLAIAE